MLEKVISAGQTGANEAGLATAKRFGLQTGGWMPMDWETADGPRPDFEKLYGMRMHSQGTRERMATNVRISDGTIRFATSFQSSNEKLALFWAREHRKPHFDVDLAAPPDPQLVIDWIKANEIKSLHVTGSTESKAARKKTKGVFTQVSEFLEAVFIGLGHKAVEVPEVAAPAAEPAPTV